MSLPSGYNLLEYIKSSGTQYINTNFKPSNNTRVICDFQLNSVPSSHVGIFGARGAASGYAGRYAFGYNNAFRTDFGSTNVSFSTSISTTSRHTVNKNNTTTVLDTYTVTSNAATFNTGYNLYIFAINTAGTVSNQASVKIYSCKIYETVVLVRDYIPCQRPDGAIGMWDDVNSVFYGNAGTGSFTAGPVLVPATPSNFHLYSSTETSATLTWDAVKGVKGYKIYRDGTLIATLTDTAYTDTIEPFNTYVYTITSYSASAESEPTSISVKIIIPPGTPTNFRVSSASTTMLALSWDEVLGADSYQLKRDGTIVYTGDSTSYTDRGLTTDTAYTYTLSAINKVGSSAEITLETSTTEFILVTDRTDEDVAARNDKGTYNAADLNRVAGAMNFVSDRLHKAGYAPQINPKINWTKEICQRLNR